MLHPQSELIVYRAVLDGELEIDDQGRVWRVEKRSGNRWTGGADASPCPKVRAEIANTQGYLQVRVMYQGKRHYATAHRLVWLHVNGPIPQGMTVNHKRGDKANNHPDELELMTYSEQRRHALDVLKVKTWQPKGSLHPKTFLTEEDVRRMRHLRASGMMIKDIAARFKMTAGATSAICRSTTWKHVV